MASNWSSHWRWLVWFCAAVILTVGVGLCVERLRSGSGEQDYADGGGSGPATGNDATDGTGAGKTAVTFNRDIAPIVFAHCSTCHHAGEAVPFQLVSFEDFKKRARQIREVVTARYMPPWMPAGGAPHFKGERILTNQQIATIQAWVDQGAPEGDERDRPPAPRFDDDWALGKPDIVVRMLEPYRVPTEGKDVYRNFVAPLALPEGKWIKAVQVRTPGASTVHHGFVFVDPTGHTAKDNDAAEPGVGYSGMDPGTGVERPPGQLLTWQPGKQPSPSPDEMSWWLPRHSDLVLQMHIRPSGKEELLQAEVALYFSDRPATVHPSAIMLRSVDIDIPAGAREHAIESSYVLPVDVEVISILPHAHYLGHRLRAWATLPDGKEQLLLRIDDWSFDWQSDFQFAEPLALPAGTRVAMRYEYDNSADNPRNPHRPPQRVTYGLNSSDEMAEFNMQVIARDAKDQQALNADYRRVYALPDAIAVARALLAAEPKSAERMVRLAVALLAGGDTGEAMRLLNQALAIQPADATARYHLGHAYAMQKDTTRAIEEWRETVRIDPAHFRAHNNLGVWYLAQRDLAKAEEHLRAAVTANENDLMSRMNLARVYAAKGEWTSVEAELREALKIDPENEAVRELWQSAREKLRIR